MDWTNVKLQAQALIKLKHWRIVKRRLLKFSAWKVGLVTTIFPQPFLAFLIGRLFFTEGCRASTDLSRFGLLILGVSPSSGLSSYICTLYKGNIELSVTILVLSTILSPLTITAFWSLFAHHMFETDSIHLHPNSPATEILEILAILMFPSKFDNYKVHFNMTFLQLQLYILLQSVLELSLQQDFKLSRDCWMLSGSH